MAAQKMVVKLEPYKEGQYPGVFTATVMDPSLGMWPGPGGEHPPYPDQGLPGPQPPFPVDPNRPHPEHPIMLPGMPGWGVPPEGGGTPPPTVATVVPMPGEAKPKPEGLPEGSANVLLVFPGQGYACEAWTLPYISHHPKP